MTEQQNFTLIDLRIDVYIYRDVVVGKESNYKKAATVNKGQTHKSHCLPHSGKDEMTEKCLK